MNFLINRERVFPFEIIGHTLLNIIMVFMF